MYQLMILLVSLGIAYEATTMAGLRWRRGERSWRGWLVLSWPIVALMIALKGEWRIALAIMLSAVVFGAAQLACVAVTTLGGLSLLWLREPQDGVVSVMFIVLIVIASDSGAYLSGRVLGGPRLAPRISPGKTRSGAIGGLLAAGLVGMVAAALFAKGSFAGGMIWGMVLGCAAQVGDLFESAAKRRVGIKDSGWLIPGHGGLLDRFDGLLAAAPLATLVSLAVPGRVFWSATIDDLVTASRYLLHLLFPVLSY